MEKRDLKTTVTVEFTGDETPLAIEVLNLIAAARKGANTSALAAAPAEPDDEPEKPARSRSTRSRKPADETTSRASRRSEPEPEPDDDEPETGNDPDDEPESRNERTERTERKVTHDDVRDLMMDVIAGDDENRAKVLKHLTKLGAKSVGAINEADLPEFFDFLQSLKDAA